jgi:DNA repair protein RadC
MTNMDTLYIHNGTQFREATSEEIIASAQVLISQRFQIGSEPMRNPDLVGAYLRLHFAALDYEVFGVLHLDASRRLIAVEEMFRGTLNSATVHPREIAHSALTRRTTSVILFHNHPSGLATPSEADQDITWKIQKGLGLFDIKVLDHIIVAETIFSFSNAGLL